MLKTMQAFASDLIVTKARLKDHITVPALENAAPDGRPNAVWIHSGKVTPATAFVAARDSDPCFSTEDGDVQTGRALTAIMFFFTLVEIGSPQGTAPDHHFGAINNQSSK